MAVTRERGNENNCEQKTITGVFIMPTVPLEQAQQHLVELLADVQHSHEALHIQGEHVNGVLIAEADWQAIQETLYLLSIPGMRDSIREGLDMPLASCERELDW
jgi:PHD/YefM family antitoxin component YafN of YafNO toxin-antitoxin module